MPEYRTEIDVPLTEASGVLRTLRTLRRLGETRVALYLEAEDEYELAMLVDSLRHELADQGLQVTIPRPQPVTPRSPARDLDEIERPHRRST